ncbi:MAG: hypothetical protein M9885_13565 [Burkholderiaceae bacterium]|nr:hypothetical protein [Burkholderiaceae bacterium]
MNSLFLSSGSDPFAHLKGHLTPVPEAPFRGVWATVEIQPDLFARQRYTVGVVVGAHEGEFQFLLLEDLSKFECIYGKNDVALLRAVLQSAEDALQEARRNAVSLGSIQFETDMVSLGELWPTSGASIEVVLSRLYADVVPFIPKEERRLRDFETMDNEAVRELVNRELKRIARMAFERIVIESVHDVAEPGSGARHRLEFNLHPEGKVGSVVSAVYKGHERVELNLLRASEDVSTFARLRNLEDRALFVMAPKPDSMPKPDMERLENVLGERLWRLEKRGFRVATHDGAQPLAQEIVDWAGVE